MSTLFRLITASAALALSGVLAVQSPAIADPAQPATPAAKSHMTEDEALNVVVRANPQAHRVSSHAINVAPGVDVIYGSALATSTNAAKTGGAAALTSDPSPNYGFACPYYYLCIWEHASSEGWGYGLAFYSCQGGTTVDLNKYRYPDAALVGNGPSSTRWNDRMSSYFNHQSTGTQARFANWGGRASKQTANSRHVIVHVSDH
ncbi:MAG TPA: hypothetical protein VFC19_28615 [Candidatus Limnocylindrales bacterium]|nr:hypothetical protein [Candidatus Limnocylindrales bacterium]